MAKKFTKDEVDFEHPASGMDPCSRCVYFQSASKSCKIVDGLIQPDDWCNKFKVNKMKKHGFHSTHIELHDDGSATIHHKHQDPAKDVKHAAADLDGIHDSLQEHLNPEEAEAEVSKKGLDSEAMEEAVSPGIHKKIAKMAAGIEGE